MARSRDWDELQHVWIEWHRKTGQKIKELYVQLVDLSNYAAQLNSKLHLKWKSKLEHYGILVSCGSNKSQICESAWLEIRIHLHIRHISYFSFVFSNACTGH